MANAIVEKAKERMIQSHHSLAREFGGIRAGRANASLLDRITVDTMVSKHLLTKSLLSQFLKRVSCW